MTDNTGPEGTRAPQWQARLRARIDSLGFDSVRDFVVARPGLAFGELAKELGPDVAHHQVQRLYLSEQAMLGRLRYAAAECLARTVIEHFPRGWDVGVRADYRKAGVISHWISDMLHRVDQDQLDEETLRAIAFALRDQVSPPAGWRPDSGADAHIQSAFRAAGV